VKKERRYRKKIDCSSKEKEITRSLKYAPTEQEKKEK
jgi:hypothetical protein